MLQKNEKTEIQPTEMDEAQHELLRICMLEVEELMLAKILEYYEHLEQLLILRKQPEKYNVEMD